MAVKIAALTVLSAFARASASACPGSTNPMMSTVTDLAPECFKLCPQMCDPMDAIIGEYMTSFDPEALKPLICADTQPFTCLYNGTHMDSCHKVLEAGKGFGIAIPMSAAELTSECGGEGAGAPAAHEGARAAHQDMGPGDGEGSNTSNASSTTTTTSSHTSAAFAGGLAWTAAVSALLALCAEVGRSAA